MGIDNGVMNQPMASIERNPDQWVDDPTWPPADTHQTALFPTADGLDIRAGTAPSPFTDDPEPERVRLGRARTDRAGRRPAAVQHRPARACHADWPAPARSRSP